MHGEREKSGGGRRAPGRLRKEYGSRAARERRAPLAPRVNEHAAAAESVATRSRAELTAAPTCESG
ncbi:hypothetical protein FHS01_004978 [Longimicrobium terrae]|uniref:Uncharacterized protein n=1 Tax=Longimicrobium terrae TaxID=1639882 RepID=A0A841H5A9_9BACT|nr:hypothetical protein [Longimicrobium terrae]MBB6073153.1 hypothetical protein [Longimicrobium terrae]